MKIQKKYPKLFKALSKPYGARKAISLLKGLEEDFSGTEWGFVDQPEPNKSFLFKGTRQGVKYWAKIAKQHFGW